MKKILIPTDFTDLAMNALKFAVDIAKNNGAQVDLIHFMDTPLDAELIVSGDTQLDDSMDSVYNIQLAQANQRKLRGIVDGLSDTGVKFHYGLGSSGFMHGTQKYVERQDVDLVIIGTTGEESVQEFFTGNHTEQLIENLNIPVISLKEEVNYDSVTDIVLGVDIAGEKYPGTSLPMIKSVAECFDAKVHLVTITKPGEAGMKSVQQSVERFAKEAKFTNYAVSVVEYEDDLDGLLYFAEKIGAGLIAIISDARKGVFRFFQESFATELTKESDLPVMVLNKRNLK